MSYFKPGFCILLLSALVVSSSDAQTTTCPKKKLFGSPPRVFYSTLKCQKDGNNCNELSSLAIKIYSQEVDTGCKDSPDCDKCKTTVTSMALGDIKPKSDKSKYPYLLFDDADQTRANDTRLDFSGYAKATSADGKELYFKFFDMSSPYVIDGKTKYISASIAVQLDVDKEPAGAVAATIIEKADECDVLQFPLQGLQVCNYAIAGQTDANGKQGVIESSLCRITDEDLLK